MNSIDQVIEAVGEAFRDRDKEYLETTNKLMNLIDTLQTAAIQQNKEIKDLQDSVTNLILLGGTTTESK